MQDFKTETGKDKINIVAHSKGGLDARVYLANNPSNDDVSKLIMIGTPNQGSPAGTATVDYAFIALLYNPLLYPYLIAFYCFPALNDLVEGSDASAEINENTDYYTIAGNWIPEHYFTYFDLSSDSNCPQLDWLPLERWIGDYVIAGEDDDGIVLSQVLLQNNLKILMLLIIVTQIYLSWMKSMKSSRINCCHDLTKDNGYCNTI